jgi:hypothetical protein
MLDMPGTRQYMIIKASKPMGISKKTYCPKIAAIPKYISAVNKL